MCCSYLSLYIFFEFKKYYRNNVKIIEYFNIDFVYVWWFFLDLCKKLCLIVDDKVICVVLFLD